MAQAAIASTSSDEDLMVHVRTRDYPAFVALFDRYRPNAVSFAARMTGDPDEAEAVAREAFVRVGSQAASYSTKKTFRVWFFTILRNLVFDRVSRRDPGPGATIDRLAAAETVKEGALASAQAEKARAVYGALNRLKPVYREVVYLRILERMSYEDIAKITVERVATVRNRMNYAIEHLRKEKLQ